MVWDWGLGVGDWGWGWGVEGRGAGFRDYRCGRRRDGNCWDVCVFAKRRIRARRTVLRGSGFRVLLAERVDGIDVDRGSGKISLFILRGERMV